VPADELFLGVDGGQSHTEALVGGRRGRVLGRGEAGGSNLSQGPQVRLAELLKAVQRAAEQAGLRWKDTRFAAACIGLSGGPPNDLSSLQRAIPCSKLEVATDAAIAREGAFEGGPGVIVIAGTGSIAWGENTAGRTARAGGWGPLFGDEGGSFDLVRRALRAALRFEEGWGPPTLLRDRLLEGFGASSANELMHRFYREKTPAEQIAAAAPWLEEVAAQGDEAALSVLQEAARALASLVDAVSGPLFGPRETVPVAYSGGAFRGTVLLAGLRKVLAARKRYSLAAPRRGPAEGALLRAGRRKG